MSYVIKSSPTSASKEPEILEQRRRDVINVGSQSIVLAEGHHHVLIVTRHLVAENIDRVWTTLKPDSFDHSLLVLPERVAENVDLASLISPFSPKKARLRCTQQFAALYSETWKSNVVYKMSRFEGTLEDLPRMRFKPDTIKNIKQMLEDSLAVLHKNKLVHGDISLRNVFYRGVYPKLDFFLGDFGSVTALTPETLAKDLRDLENMLDKIQRIYNKKYATSSKDLSEFEEQCPSLAASLRKKNGRSPIVQGKKSCDISKMRPTRKVCRTLFSNK